MRVPLSLTLTVAASSCLLPSEPVERLDLSISLSADRMRPDSGVLVRVEATNRTTRPVHLETTGGCVVSFAVVAPNNVDVGPRFGCSSILVLRDIAPSEAVVMEYNLVPTPRLDQITGAVRWPAGTYQVVGHLLDRHTQIVRRTKPVLFELVCRDPSWTEC